MESKVDDSITDIVNPPRIMKHISKRSTTSTDIIDQIKSLDKKPTMLSTNSNETSLPMSPQRLNSATHAKTPDVINHLLGICLLFITAITLLTSQYLFKIVAKKFNSSPHEMLLIRGYNTIVISLVPIFINKLPLVPDKPGEGYLLTLRSVFHMLNSVLYFIALLNLDVSLGTLIYCLIPLFIGILSPIFLKDPIFVADIMCVLISVVGLVFICKQPYFLFGGYSKDSLEFYISLLLAIIGMLCSSFNGIISRKISVKVNFHVLNFYYGVLLTIAEAFVLHVSNTKTYFEITKFLAINGVHSVFYLGSYTYYYSHNYLMAITASFNFYIQSLFAFLTDIIIIGVAVDVFNIIGASFIILSGVLFLGIKIWREKKVQEKISP